MFDITSRIRFNTRVISITKSNLHNSQQPWSVTIDTSAKTETLKFDFVVVASGLFSHYDIPTFQGQENFAGQIVHANEIKTAEQLNKKKILVIGGCKTAIDMAINVATISKHCDFVFRRIHIIFPVKVLRGFLPIRFLFTRFYVFFNQPYPNAPYTRFYWFMHRYFPWIFNFVRSFMANDTILSNPSELYDDGIFLPRGSMSDGLLILPTHPVFTELKKTNRIQGHLASIQQILDSNTVQLDNGEVLNSIDMIICATDRCLRFPFFSEKDAQIMGLPSKSSKDFNLYRRIVPINVPNIAFIGFTSVFTHWLITEVASHWISDYFKGYQLLPSRARMEDEVTTVREFSRKNFGRTSPHVSSYWLEAIEIYLNDMNLSLKRTNNWLSENFSVYRPNRFKTLHEERRARDRGLEQYSNRFYLSFFHCLTIVFIFLVFFFTT